MSSTYTTNLHLRRMSHRDPDNVENWDAVTNANWNLVDQAIGYAGPVKANIDAINADIVVLDAAVAAIHNPTVGQADALAGEGTPSATNKFVTKDYIIIPRKLILFPEYIGATFTQGDGSDHTGDFTSDVELSGTNYLYNFYQWISDTASPLQRYDIVCKFRIPETFSILATSKALVVDICTQAAETTDNKVDVTITKDGLDPDTYFAQVTGKTSDAATWASEVESSAVAYFDKSTLDSAFVTAPLSAGDTVNVRITMYSENNSYVKIGAITFQYTG